MKKIEFLGASLHTGLFCTANGFDKVHQLIGITEDQCRLSNSKDGYFSPRTENFNPIVRPLSDLTKPIMHNGEAFVPILKLAEILIDAKIKKETVTTVDEKTGWIGCEFWDIKSQRYLMCIFMPKYGLSIVDNCQDELMFSTIAALQKLIEWHFNLMDDSEPFVPATEEFNPYK